uniref:NADH-ubiquinone oxidoreductase chain 5 n=1 Tax=Glycera cf. tridactyla FS19 TaxID=1763829 RepID=A0A0S3CQZ4_9ANNE|nr:NADH dehydrogenase subunit 5 [Glycera cf. tridactyla FS19]
MLWSRILWILSLSMLFTSLFLSMYMKTFIIEWSILSMNSSEIFMPIILDPMGSMFSATVLFISANVIHFSNYYMQDELFIKRFTHIVLLFVLSMNMLIFLPHLMVLLLGWDGLGITSFILVIYYQNPKSLAAGMITALTNRIGDVMILLSVAWSLNQGHWLIINMWNSSFSFMICATITIAAMTKSAQMPFSSWLPAAMAAPTPVSALVHSSTLVTAGVFLIIRFYPMLSTFFMFNLFLLMVSTMTMFMAGMSALVETDLKKIIALSTLSQLGVMMASISLNLPNLAFFHLITHAMFKALLFVCAGSMIHLHHHNQDLRSMGNSADQLPLTMACLLSANMALCGLPFMAGFYSKDMIIEMCLFNHTNMIIMFMFILATMMTAAYSIRLMVTALISNNMSLPIQYTSDNSLSNTTPMMFLSMGAILGGSLINWISVLPMKEPILDLNLKSLAFVVTILGAFFMFSKSTSNTPSFASSMFNHMNAFMWFLTPLSSQATLKTPMSICLNSMKSMDQGWIEMSSAQGVFSLFSKSAAKIQSVQVPMFIIHLSLIVTFILFSIL